METSCLEEAEELVFSVQDSVYAASVREAEAGHCLRGSARPTESPAHARFADSSGSVGRRDDSSEALPVLKEELAKLTDKVQKSVREDLQKFLQDWAERHHLQQERKPSHQSHTPRMRLQSPPLLRQVSDNEEYDDANDDDGTDWLMRHRKSHAARSELAKPTEIRLMGRKAERTHPHYEDQMHAKLSECSTEKKASGSRSIGVFRFFSRAKTVHESVVKDSSRSSLEERSAGIVVQEVAKDSSASSGSVVERGSNHLAVAHLDSQGATVCAAGTQRLSADSQRLHEGDGTGSAPMGPLHSCMFVPSRQTMQVKASINMSQKPSTISSWHRYAASIVNTASFNSLIGALIVLNAIWIGVQTEWDMRTSLYDNPTPASLRAVSSAFCVIFTAELIFRLAVQGKLFFFEADWRWNVFDLTIVSLQLSEEIMEHVASYTLQWSYGSSWMRVLRALRLARIVRLVRILRLLKELRTMLGSIACTLNSLFWTLVLLLLITYAGSICIAQTVADHALHSPEDVEKGTPLQVYYGSLLSSMLALYQAISGGVDWREISDPLDDKIGSFMSFLFVCFIAFTTLSLLNIVTGIFVESALENTKAEGDLDMINRLTEVIGSADLQNGMISWTDFDTYLETPQMQAYFKSVDLDTSEAKHLFKLLDVSDTGSIHAEDFIMGCLRLRGAAKAIDLATLMSETRKMHRHWKMQNYNLQKLMAGLISAVNMQHDDATARSAQIFGAPALLSRNITAP